MCMRVHVVHRSKWESLCRFDSLSWCGLFPSFIRGRTIHVHVEFIPASHQYLLTVLSIWWAIGQLVGSLASENGPKVSLY